MELLNKPRENAYKKIKELAGRFDEQKPFYIQTNYNETQTRRDFIDPFFKALGWDIDNENGYAESYREVIHEDRVKIGNTNKAPDYSFRLVGGKRLFFVEAKKPSVLIKEQAEPAFQVRRYGWSAKLPVSIITDFQEFAVYDCTKKPLLTDKAATARIKYLTYTDYLNDFGFLWDTFSKQRVLEGSFDKFIQNDTYKKGTATVDKEFLQSLDSWRTQLAISISKHNKHLNEDEINFAVQQTIDRIIFLRIAEDRSIEPYGSLRDCIKDGNLYQNLYNLFVKADEKYNSGLFDFNKDKISHRLEIENKVLKSVLNELYFPCPYEFSVLPVEILGTAYEQFLGKQIKIDKSHRVSIEEKPAVRKAGGVYYTPQYIVEYIVKNTIGKLVENKSPKEVIALKIVDPACGSGSFLLGAYDFLLNWHKDFYTQNGKTSKGSKNDTLTPDGSLTTAEKKRILLNNIYGVDIDTNAVEVTKLSLLIKCMEGETEASIATQMRLFHDRVLPTLDNNIKSGNSLIDTDYYDYELDFDDEKKIKPFNWQKSFPETFKQGGFDAVIGNPPWVQSKFLEEHIKTYFARNYESMSGQYDLFNGFIERSKTILKKNGHFGFIIPNRFITGNDYKDLRKFILTNFTINEIADVGENIFHNVIMPSAILIYKNQKNNSEHIFNAKIKVKDLIGNDYMLNQVNQSSLLKDQQYNFTIYQNKTENGINKKIEQCPALKDLVTNARGVEIGKKSNLVFDKPIPKSVPFLTGENMGRYYIKGCMHIKLGDNATDYKSPELYKGEKIIIRKTGKGLNATIDRNNHYVIQVIYIFKKKEATKEHLNYILGLLNSKLLSFYYFKKFGEEDKKAFPHIRQGQVLSIPFKTISFSDKTEKQSHDEISKHVENLIQLNEQLSTENLAINKEQIKQRIEYNEERINQLVYKLYHLTEEEIKTVEESFKD